MAANGVAIFGAGLAGGAGLVGLAWAVGTRGRRYSPGTLAEYGDHRRDPVGDALRHGLTGAQVPVCAGPDGELYLGWREPDPERTLRRTVLEPLLRRVAATGGMIYPGEPFTLLLELPGESNYAVAADAAAYRSLEEVLRDHAAILTRWVGDRMIPGPVTVLVSGALGVRHLLAAAHTQYAAAVGTFDDVGSWSAPAHLVPLVNEHWLWRFGWDGRDQMPVEERHLLHGLVHAAHQDGRRVRFFGIPERPWWVRNAFWMELSAAGVDLIGARKLRTLAARARHAACSAPVGEDQWHDVDAGDAGRGRPGGPGGDRSAEHAGAAGPAARRAEGVVAG